MSLSRNALFADGGGGNEDNWFKGRMFFAGERTVKIAGELPFRGTTS